MDYDIEALKLHESAKGKISVIPKVPVDSHEDLKLVYTPGVAAPCKKIADNPEDAYKYTIKQNFVAVVSDGSAVLGLGNIGGLAGLPVMEGKAALFKKFADVDAIPLVLSTQNPQEIIQTVRAVAPTFGGINLEDIKAPECFYITEALQDLDIPVFHDDQDGTAIVVLAALKNALKVVNKDSSARIVIIGAGAAGIAITRLLVASGAKNIILVDSRGIVPKNYENSDNKYKEAIAHKINPEEKTGTLADALQGADVVIGVSQANLLTKELVESMNDDPIIFALANPEPEIRPDVAISAGAKVVATGRSDFPNQINNVLVFPGLFRGLLDARIKTVTDEMKLLVAQTVADLVDNPSPQNIIPRISKEVSDVVAQAIKRKK